MPQIVVKRKFRMCVGTDVHPTDFLPSTAPIEVNDRVAEVSIMEGWAVPFVPQAAEETPAHGLPSPVSGQAKPVSSSPPAKALRKRIFGSRRAKRGSS